LGFVVLADIVQEFSFEIRRGSEYAAGDYVAFNLAKPELKLVEPGE
jgi:hypothetical protein